MKQGCYKKYCRDILQPYGCRKQVVTTKKINHQNLQSNPPKSALGLVDYGVNFSNFYILGSYIFPATIPLGHQPILPMK
jgi:hypothetical protein